MKKITTLFAVLLANFAISQTFPSPYCNITFVEDIEEITSVTLNGTTISNTEVNNIVVDNTNTVINLVRGESYTVNVKGNTHGDYSNDIYFYIDYNQNGILNDANENIFVGMIYDETGDASSSGATSSAFTVPTTAILGSTRARVIKTYFFADWGEISIDNPCAISAYDVLFEENYDSYGQALDFTINILEATASLEDNIVNNIKLYPNPANNYFNITAPESIKKIEIINILGQNVLVKDTSTNNEMVDISFLQSGSYIVKVTSENDFTKNLKIVKK